MQNKDKAGDQINRKRNYILPIFADHQEEGIPKQQTYRTTPLFFL